MSWEFEHWMREELPDIHIQFNGASGKWDAICILSERPDWAPLTLSFEYFPTPEMIRKALDKQKQS